MNSNRLSFRGQMQLTALRILTVLLGLVDGLFNIRWGECQLKRLTRRWQSQLIQLDAAIIHLEQERKKLEMQAEALAIHAAVVYLGGRSLANNELLFDPDDPRDEEILDASIDLLVKQRLATIETEEIKAGHYIYHLEPDWSSIRSRLANAANQAEPEIADWFRDSLKFIDEAFLPEAPD